MITHEETAVRNDAPLADDHAITRADIKGTDIRLFDGRRKVGTIDLPSLADPAPKAEVVEGILAGMAFPTTRVAMLDHLEASLAEVEQRRSGSVIPDTYRHQYGVDQNNGDDLAQNLKDYCGGGLNDPLDLDRLREVVDTNGIADRFDVWMTKGLNNGMLRMNTGNVLRGKVRKGEVVRIGDRKWNEVEATA